MEDLKTRRHDLRNKRPAMTLLNKYLLIIASLFSAVNGSTFSCDTLTYQTIAGSETTSTVFTISELEYGKKATAEYHRGGITSFSEVFMTDNFLTKNWRYQSEQDKSNLCGTLSRDTLILNGIFKNKAVDKKLRLNSIAWKQMFPFDLRKFVLSDSIATSFCGVSILEIAHMRLGTLDVKKIGMEHLTINGKDQELLHVKVMPAGVFSVFWHGDYWFRKSCGTMVKSVSVDYPGSPPVISILEN
jgi:hypothetical protein